MTENQYHLEAKRKYFAYLMGRYVTSTGESSLVVPEQDQEIEIGSSSLNFLNRLAAYEVILYLLGLPLEQIRQATQTNQLIGPTINREDELQANILFYVNSVADDNSIHAPVRRSRKLIQTEQTIASILGERDVLPSNLMVALTQDSHELPNILRTVFIARYLSFSLGASRWPNKTDFWRFSTLNLRAREDIPEEWYDQPEKCFYNNPPLDPEELSTRNRILVVGTNVETREISEFFKPNELSLLVTGIDYASRMANFWQKFFNTEDFLDDVEGRTKPAGIVTTGLIRNYNYMGGESVPVENRIADIAEHFKLRIKVINSFAP